MEGLVERRPQALCSRLGNDVLSVLVGDMIELN